MKRVDGVIRPRRFRTSGFVLTFIAAFSWPLTLLAINLYDIARPERVIVFGLVVWGLGLALVFLLVVLGLRVDVAENTTFVTLALVMSGGLLLRRFDLWFAYSILVACPVLVGWAFVKLRHHAIPSALVWAAAIAVISGPVITLLNTSSGAREPSVMSHAQPLQLELARKPDIFLVVFDGYPGAIAADQDDLGIGEIDVVRELEMRGFQVPESSWSAYWATSLSIPSLLEMDYPVDSMDWRGERTIKDLHGVISGDSAFVDALRENGYTTHMIESGWSAGSCGEAYDQCVTSFSIDEAIYLLLRRTVAWPLVDRSPGPYALGTLAAFDWLLANSPVLSRSDSPDFVFSHVVSPHAPYLLKPDCSAEFVNERAGTEFQIGGVPADSRTTYLIEQIDCLDRLMIELAEAIDPEDVVIFVSDHGTDRRGQSNPGLVDWDRETTVERLNNFLAVRLPSGCSVGEEVVVPNVLRRVLGCFTPSTIEDLPERMWINPMVELEADLVKELLGMRAAPAWAETNQS